MENESLNDKAIVISKACWNDPKWVEARVSYGLLSIMATFIEDILVLKSGNKLEFVRDYDRWLNDTRANIESYKNIAEKIHKDYEQKL